MSSYEDNLAAVTRDPDRRATTPGSPVHGRVAGFAVRRSGDEEGNRRHAQQPRSRSRGSQGEPDDQVVRTPSSSSELPSTTSGRKPRSSPPPPTTTRHADVADTAVTAAAAAAPANKEKRKSSSAAAPKQRLQYDDPSAVAKAEKKAIVKRAAAERIVPLFSHLPQYERIASVSLGAGFHRLSAFHPSVVRLGLQTAEEVVTGSSARTSAMLLALRDVVADFAIPPESETQDLRRELDKALKRHIQFLVDCRPISVSMGNAVRFVKSRLAALPPTLAESEAKARLVREIDEFLDEKVVLALQTIAAFGAERIRDGDVVVTYASSYSVESILTRAAAEGRRFRVIVIDSRPKFEGRLLARRLSSCGIECEYALLSAAPLAIADEASLVLLGAEACMSNGAILSAAGTASVAMAAKRERVPVVFACETIKFSERVQLDAICFNELGDPDELLLRWSAEDEEAAAGGGGKQGASAHRRRQARAQKEARGLDAGWRRTYPELKLLNLAFDLTPAELVDAMITEVALVPPTAVPAITREYRIVDV